MLQKDHFMKKARHNIFFVISMFMLIFPFCSLAASSQNKACPENTKTFLAEINTNLSHKKWVNIDVHSCLQIQDEITQQAINIIEREDFFNYLPLMNKKTLRIIRNTFFAKRGYIFKDDSLYKVFSSFSWYRPTKEAPLNLSNIEKNRVDLIKRIEDRLESEVPDDKEEEFQTSNAIKQREINGNTYLLLKDKLLVSYEHGGCCGAVSDSLLIADLNSKPISIANCGEPVCESTQLLSDIDSQNLYFFVRATETNYKSYIESSINHYNYEYIGTNVTKPHYQSLFMIKENGTLDLISEARKDCKRVPLIGEKGKEGWFTYECNEPLSEVYLLPNAYDGYCHDEIATMIRFDDRIIQFWQSSYYLGN